MKIFSDTNGNRTRLVAQCLNQLRHRVLHGRLLLVAQCLNQLRHRVLHGRLTCCET